MNSQTKHRVLLLSPFFYPEQISTGKYNTFLVKSLVERGCHVNVIASHPLYPGWIPLESADTLSGTEIYRGGLNIRYPNSTVVRRLILELWFSWHTISTFLKIRNKFDCIVPIFPPSLFFLLLTKIVPRKTKRIGIVHDLQGVYMSRSRNFLRKIINYAIHIVEKKCFESCDKVIFLSNSMAKRAIEDYQLDPKSCVVCYPFITEFSNQPDTGDALAHIFPKNRMHVVYSGALGDKQNPRELFSFMDRLASENPTICCHIFSGGPLFEKLKTDQTSVHDSKIFFHNLVPAEHLNELYARSDVQIIPQAFGTSDGSLPSKLPNLLSAGVSIFSICDPGSELGELVQASGTGYVAYTWNSEELVKEFAAFLDRTKSQLRSSRKEAMQYFNEERFSVQNLVTEITSIKKEKH